MHPAGTENAPALRFSFRTKKNHTNGILNMRPTHWVHPGFILYTLGTPWTYTLYTGYALYTGYRFASRPDPVHALTRWLLNESNFKVVAMRTIISSQVSNQMRI